jgi:hypothetical protein
MPASIPQHVSRQQHPSTTMRTKSETRMTLRLHLSNLMIMDVLRRGSFPSKLSLSQEQLQTHPGLLN